MIWHKGKSLEPEHETGEKKKTEKEILQKQIKRKD
jgi:hypothetical protein